jgi:hypothetical protein
LGEKKEPMKKAILIGLLLALPVQIAGAKECTQMEAYAAESVTDYLDSWENVNQAFKEFGHCDDGAIAEGFDEAISLLWANQWQKLPEMIKYSKESRTFKAFVYKRVWSESVPIERWQKILKNAQEKCPPGSTEFCSEIIRASNSACIGVDRNLSEQDKSIWAPPITRHLNIQLATTLQKPISIQASDILLSLGYGGWHIIYVDTHVSDESFLFYNAQPTKCAAYITLWSGAAMASEEAEIKRWVQDNAEGIPPELAGCFARYVTKGRVQ